MTDDEHPESCWIKTGHKQDLLGVAGWCWCYGKFWFHDWVTHEMIRPTVEERVWMT